MDPRVSSMQDRYDCSATPKCQEGEQREIPGDCTGYQVCQKGNFKDAKCSGLDKFNPTTKSCELLFKCDYCKPGPKQAVPKDCESYMICDKGVMKKESCSFGKSRSTARVRSRSACVDYQSAPSLLEWDPTPECVVKHDFNQSFNPKTHECDWAWNVACDQPSPTVKPKATTTAVTPKRSTTTKKPLPKTPKPQPPKDKCYDKAARPVNGSCSQYFECEPSTGDFKLTSCRLCKNFHPGEGRCVWPWQYPCRDPTGQPPTQRPLECSNGQKHPVDCKIYQICIQGKWHTEQCSWGYHFDVVKLECRFAWWAKC
ncbi:hypothetical protein AAG570_007236 [Ranatra chinensis]|uniref:Chitin-binding type-2 domain-containing protein n=1 Tax=Ranatra chinensis TaxID=642074 RepID=A0ABD0YJ32_9HEMI